MPSHRVFAALYDRLFAASEKAGLREMRAKLLADAQGRVLELGAGTGLNLEHYGPAVIELVLTEPDPHMAKRMRDKLSAAETSFAVDVVETGAETLPFEDGSFDTVVGTLVFCTIPDPEAAAAEVRRVLKPGGRLLVLEHVRGAHGAGLERWQDRLEKPWGLFAGGCHPNRDTAAMLGAHFDVAGLQSDEFPGHVPPLVKPVIRGSATPPATE
jgi:ubiquinone/menaquinone biosynthesis C-methylase UbiE